jgi:putative Mg2+ transporter-C (MgtC) family protein
MLPESHLTLEADLRLAFRLVVASLFAALIGWERETKNKPAGLRTHMLVGVSAALFVSLGEVMIVKYRAEGLLMRLDMINILAAVVSGVSFLGAGMIFRARGKDIHGLTTAASVLATAAVGVTVGLERYLLAGCATLLLFIILRVLALLEKEQGSGEKND